MSWSGTVYCGYCRGKGHNRRGCEQYKNAQKERYDEAVQTPEDERSYYDTIAIRRWEERQQKKSTPRNCSYCGEQGHNRRSCKPLKVHIEYVLKQEVAFRKVFVNHLKEIGLNVGSLIVPCDPDASTRRSIENIPHLVTDIQWDYISICQAKDTILRFVIARPVSSLLNNHKSVGFTIRAPEHWPTRASWVKDDQRWQEEQFGLEVISGSPGTIKAPDGWIEDDTAVKEYFKDRESWMWPSSDNTSYYSCDWWDLEKDQELKESA